MTLVHNRSLKPKTGKGDEVQSAPRRRRTLLGAFISPALFWLLVFVIAPYVTLFTYSLWTAGYTSIDHKPSLANFRGLWSDQVLHQVALRSAGIALIVTVITFLLALCLAYCAVMFVKRKDLFVFAVVLPLWVSYIIRAFAWRLVLGDHGVLNSALMSTGLIKAPVDALIFSKTAVVILLVHEYLAFMFVPLYAALDGLDKNILLAAQDLYASPLRRFLRVTIPLSAPGIAVGVMFVFPLSFGDYIAPDLVGGPDSKMIGSLVSQQFGVDFNWPYGATIALGILTLVLLVVWLMERWSKSEEIRMI